MRWARRAARIEEPRSAYKFLVSTPEEKRSLGRNRNRCEDNIRTDFREIIWENVHWTYDSKLELAAGSCEHGNKASGSIKGGGLLDL
jgi:hypothetical protein